MASVLDEVSVVSTTGNGVTEGSGFGEGADVAVGAALGDGSVVGDCGGVGVAAGIDVGVASGVGVYDGVGVSMGMGTSVGVDVGEGVESLLQAVSTPARSNRTMASCFIGFSVRSSGLILSFCKEESEPVLAHHALLSLSLTQY